MAKLEVGLKLFLVRVGLLVGSLVIFLLLAEGTLRLFPSLLPYDVREILQAKKEDFGVAHPYIGHLDKPLSTGVISGLGFRAVHHTDAYGFRNACPWPERAEIVALGDSLTFGYGAEDDQSWPAILARRFAPNRVMNFGLIGAGTTEYLRVYETFGAKLHPKLALIGFFPNDFYDADLFDRWLKSGAGGSYMYWRVRGSEFTWRHPVKSLKGALYEHSYVANLIKSALHSWRAGKPVIYSCAHGGRLRLTRSWLEGQAARSQPGTSAFRLVLDALVKMHQLADREGSQVLVLLQPSKEEVYFPILGLDTPDPTSSLRMALQKERIEYLDLAPALRQRATAGECLYFEADGHPNASGYAAIAEIVATHIKQNAEKYGLNSNCRSQALPCSFSSP
jgi:lysophospholipase L1-like esterase